jgi:hypothetical protein
MQCCVINFDPPQLQQEVIERTQARTRAIWNHNRQEIALNENHYLWIVSLSGELKGGHPAP